jgi:hypothetical protein
MRRKNMPRLRKRLEAVIPWEDFSASVREAEQLARDEDFDPLALLTEHYSQLRRYGPTLLEAFEFHPAAVAQELIEAVEFLRQMNRAGSRKVQSNAPTGFIRKRWKSYVFTAEGIDRRFYELCVMAELKNALRSGDVSVSGSRQFRAFEEYLMPHAEFNVGIEDGSLRLAGSTSPLIIWMHVCHSCVERSIKPILLQLKANCQRQNWAVADLRLLRWTITSRKKPMR